MGNNLRSNAKIIILGILLLLKERWAVPQVKYSDVGSIFGFFTGFFLIFFVMDPHNIHAAILTTVFAIIVGVFAFFLGRFVGTFVWILRKEVQKFLEDALELGKQHLNQVVEPEEKVKIKRVRKNIKEVRKNAR